MGSGWMGDGVGMGRILGENVCVELGELRFVLKKKENRIGAE